MEKKENKRNYHSVYKNICEQCKNLGLSTIGPIASVFAQQPFLNVKARFQKANWGKYGNEYVGINNIIKQMENKDFFRGSLSGVPKMFILAGLPNFLSNTIFKKFSDFDNLYTRYLSFNFISALAIFYDAQELKKMLQLKEQTTLQITKKIGPAVFLRNSMGTIGYFWTLNYANKHNLKYEEIMPLIFVSGLIFGSLSTVFDGMNPRLATTNDTIISILKEKTKGSFNNSKIQGDHTYKSIYKTIRHLYIGSSLRAAQIACYLTGIFLSHLLVKNYTDVKEKNWQTEVKNSKETSKQEKTVKK